MIQTNTYDSIFPITDKIRIVNYNNANSKGGIFTNLSKKKGTLTIHYRSKKLIFLNKAILKL